MHLRINSNTNTALNGRADQQCEVHIADLGTSAPISNKTLKHEWIPSLHNFQGSRASECQLALVPRLLLSFFQLLFELPQLPLNRCKEGLHVLANLRFVIWGEILLIVEPYVYLTRNIRKDISWATTRGSQSSPNKKKHYASTWCHFLIQHMRMVSFFFFWNYCFKGTDQITPQSHIERFSAKEYFLPPSLQAPQMKIQESPDDLWPSCFLP